MYLRNVIFFPTQILKIDRDLFWIGIIRSRQKKDKSHFTVDYFEFQDKKRGLENDV